MSFTPTPLTFLIRGRFNQDRIIFPAESVPVVYLSIDKFLREEVPGAVGKTPRDVRRCLAERRKLAVDVKKVARVDGITDADRKCGANLLLTSAWSLEDGGQLQQETSSTGSFAPKRLLKLTFDGEHLSAQNPRAPEVSRVYRALLEQGTLQLDVAIDDPEVPEDTVIAPLFVKLLVQLR